MNKYPKTQEEFAFRLIKYMENGGKLLKWLCFPTMTVEKSIEYLERFI